MNHQISMDPEDMPTSSSSSSNTPFNSQLNYIHKLENSIKTFGRNTLSIIEHFKNLQEPSNLSSIDSITQIQRPFQEHANVLANQINNALMQLATACNPNILKIIPILKFSLEFGSAQPNSAVIASQNPQPLLLPPPSISETSTIPAVSNTPPNELTALFNTTTTQTASDSRKRKLSKLPGTSSKKKSSKTVQTVKRKRQSLGARKIGSLSRKEVEKIKKKLDKIEWNAIRYFIEIPTPPLTDKRYTVIWRDIKLSSNEYKVFKTMKVSKHKHTVEKDNRFFIIKWEESIETNKNLFGRACLL